MEARQDNSKTIKNKDYRGLTKSDKLEVSLALLGSNKHNATEIDDDHIPKVLELYAINLKEARQILLDTKKAHAPLRRKNVLEPMIISLERAEPTLKNPTNTLHTSHIVIDKHSEIFKNNAFEVWQSMFEEFEIKESSRSDIKFMFEEMKKKDLIHPRISQEGILDWINDIYEINVQKTSNYSRTKVRIGAFGRAIVLYKSTI